MSEAKLLAELLEAHKHLLIDHVPHSQAIQMELVKAQPYEAWVRVPYDARLIGNPDTGVLHGGVITTLLDSVCGSAVMCSLTELSAIATLDLRIDYMKPAEPGQAIFGHAHCYRTTRNIAFVRGSAYHDTPDDPIATCVGTFMLAANRSLPEVPLAEGMSALGPSGLSMEKP